MRLLSGSSRAGARFLPAALPRSTFARSVTSMGPGEGFAWAAGECGRFCETFALACGLIP